jgi:hypothetical protein
MEMHVEETPYSVEALQHLGESLRGNRETVPHRPTAEHHIDKSVGNIPQ